MARVEATMQQTFRRVHRMLQKAAESIRNLHSSVLGVVITDVSETNKPYAMYKSYKYKSYDYEYKKV